MRLLIESAGYDIFSQQAVPLRKNYSGGIDQIAEHHRDPYELAAELDWPLGLLQDERKLRRFMCACCRQIWSRLPGVAQQALTIAEAYAAGLASAETLANERGKLWRYLGKESCNFASPWVSAVRAVICCVYKGVTEEEALDLVALLMDFCNNVEDNRPAQYRLLCEVFGYPGEPVVNG